MLQFFKKIWRKLFYFDEWLIGIAEIPMSLINQKQIIDNYQVLWLENPSKLKFRADPFLIKINSQSYIIFEEYCQIKKRGIIAIAELRNQKLINQKTLIDDHKHLSYPFIFQEAENIFIICESYKSKKTYLYQLDSQVLEVKIVREIFANFGAIDPTILRFDNKYWLFYSKSNNPNRDLYLGFTNSLSNQFIQHPQSPIKICQKSSRSAGPIAKIDGKLYRPSQNCENFYGENITINKINLLDEKVFIEEFCSTILPSKKYPKITGIHTISFTDNGAIIDGFRQSFLLYKPFVSLFRNLRRLFKKY